MGKDLAFKHDAVEESPPAALTNTHHTRGGHPQTLILVLWAVACMKDCRVPWSGGS